MTITRSFIMHLVTFLMLGAKYLAAADETIVVPSGVPHITLIGGSSGVFDPNTNIEIKKVRDFLAAMSMEQNTQIFLSHASSGKLLPGRVTPTSPAGEKLISCLAPDVKEINIWLACNLASNSPTATKSWLEVMSLRFPGTIHIGFADVAVALPAILKSDLPGNFLGTPGIKDWRRTGRRLGLLTMFLGNGLGKNHIHIVKDGGLIHTVTVTPTPIRGFDIPGHGVVAENLLIHNPIDPEPFYNLARSDIDMVPTLDIQLPTRPSGPKRLMSLPSKLAKAKSRLTVKLPVAGVGGLITFGLTNIATDLIEAQPQSLLAQGSNYVGQAIAWTDRQLWGVPSTAVFRAGLGVSDLTTRLYAGSDQLAEQRRLEALSQQSPIPVMRAARPWYRHHATEWPRMLWKSKLGINRLMSYWYEE